MKGEYISLLFSISEIQRHTKTNREKSIRTIYRGLENTLLGKSLTALGSLRSIFHPSCLPFRPP